MKLNFSFRDVSGDLCRVQGLLGGLISVSWTFRETFVGFRDVSGGLISVSGTFLEECIRFGNVTGGLI
jgi:hypothetical protein